MRRAPARPRARAFAVWPAPREPMALSSLSPSLPAWLPPPPLSMLAGLRRCRQPKAPPLSAYLCFAHATRLKLVEEAKAQARADGDGPGQGGSSFSSAIERQLGKAWKELGAEEKKQGSWWIIALPPVPGNRPIRPRGGSRGSSCSC